MAFQALVTTRGDDGKVNNAVEMLDEAQLPDGDVLVSVEWAGFNYKDGLCLKGLGNIVRSFPHVAGIDFAGRVIESTSARYHPGQAVILTGWRVGESHWGGFAQRARVKSDWLVPMPKGFSTRTAMVLGTAGLTAMLAINRLKAEGIDAGDGEVLVTGAGGGVGTIAIMLLSRMGYEVAALTGRPELANDLRKLGAVRVVSRNDVLTPTGKALDSPEWVAAVDAVGGPLLGEILKKIRPGGAVAAVGNAGGLTWEASILPFILRGVSLIGIDSVMQPFAARTTAWDRLTTLFAPAAFEGMVKEIGLAALPAAADMILKGQVAGRVIVNPRSA